jgi:hypothetical protein
VYAILIIVIILLFIKIFKNIKIQGENYNQRKTHEYYNNLHGDTYDNDAKQTIAYGEAIDNPNAMDHYRIGTAYLIAANNPRMANQHFRRALDQIVEGTVEFKDVPFIIDRIDDYKYFFVDFPDIDELPIQEAILTHFENRKNVINNLAKEKITISKDDPNFTQKLLLTQQAWESDSQNVHDTAIYNELKEQYIKVRNSNARIPNIQLKNYKDCINWLELRYENDEEKSEKIDKVKHFLNKNYPISGLNATEQDLLSTIWQRAYDPENKENFNELREAIGDSIMDCVEGNNVVCLSGRTAKMWQALATLDKDPTIGILKSKQYLRNEIYEKCAKIVDEYVGNNGSTSTELKRAYQKDEQSEQVKELKECIIKQIDNIKMDYINLLPEQQLNEIILECKAVI